MKKIFILAYYFPPYKGVSCFRTSKFVKLLPAHGWEPTVFTVHPKYYKNNFIKNLKPQIDSSNIIKIPYINFPGNALIIKILFPLIALTTFILNKKKFSAFYTSGSPYHPFILTSIITGVFKKPSIIDFRDPWSYNYGFDGRNGTFLKKLISFFIYSPIEIISIKYASKVCFATSVLKNEYSELIPKFKNKYITIPNGIDTEDFKNIKPIKISRKFNIIVTGKIFMYTPGAVKNILKYLTKNKNIHFIYIGTEDKTISKLAVKYNVKSQVTSLPFMPYKKVLNYIAGADATITSTGLKFQIGTKIFDYLFLNKPVLCLSPKDSIVSKTLKTNKNILISEEPHSFCNIQKNLDNLQKIQSQSIDKSFIPTRQDSTKTLASILNKIS
ncbi:MAG: hypothetical protein RBR53_07415 [Desulforegulaceae bacterium]|nr:hypothetical protein [Desulforegulaceae bacterium]